MKTVYSVDQYIESHPKWHDALTHLRQLLHTTELVETLKWSAPVYTINGKNVVGIGAFKQYFGLWFYNGVFLKDKHQLLINAQEGKTKAMRQMRFTNTNAINDTIILQYVNEAIKNQKLGKEIKPNRTVKAIIIPLELQQALDIDTALKNNFDAFTPYKQREYCEYISSAKREATKQSRLQKIVPMIMQGIGLNDKYKKL